RALLEFDRTLLYLLALALFASLGGQAWRLRWMVGAMALAIVVVCAAALASRLLPDVLPATTSAADIRLNYPITYSNSLGLLAALGIVLCFGLTCSERASRPARVLAAAALPVLSAALLLTLSRGALAAAIIGLVVFLVVGHPRALAAGLAAAVPATTIAVTRTYDARLLFSANPLTQAARDQGEHIAVVLALCALGAAIVRALLLVSDRAVGELRVPPQTRRLVLGAGAGVLAVVVAAAAIAFDVRRQYEAFVDAPPVPAATTDDVRSRLVQADNNGRLEFWRVAFGELEAQPLRGRGAGTFELSWERERRNSDFVRNAHSLYLEVMSELGLVGLALLAATLLAILIGLARRVRGPDRALFATILAACATWLVAAGADWHWELPAVTLWLFALGGTAIARVREQPVGRPILALVPRFAVAGALSAVMALVPLALHGSQGRLEKAIAQLERGRCERVETLARQSLNGVGVRPQGYELLARCALEMDDRSRAIRMIGEAIERDPENWRPWYGLAVVRARAGLDPRPAARSALRRNPNEPLAREAVRRFSVHANAGGWRRASRGLNILVPPL
ncbi:MAG TPA: O-antigen ligase family protein, partial [Solirubrobacteraceae bacterium]|nr:O-antigen ligase family protein [Solirubrobacteraceae bacterium]